MPRSTPRSGPGSTASSPACSAWRRSTVAATPSGNGNGSQRRLAAAAATAVEEDFPWHDPALPLDERLELAEDRPYDRRLMAAMAQLDCGACGYLCKTYSEAIASGEEKDLKRCTPGGKETARKLKELVAAQGAATTSGAAMTSVVAGNGHHDDGQRLGADQRRRRPTSTARTHSRPS